jgi:hypothetical protein
MFKKLTLAAAAGAGYVLGAKAGTQRYQQIVEKAREIAGMPAVQSATSTVQQTAAPLVDKAKGTVSDKVSAVTDKASGGSSSPSTPASPVVDLPATGAGATTRTTSAAGAAPSATAPVTRP